MMACLKDILVAALTTILFTKHSYFYKDSTKRDGALGVSILEGWDHTYE